MRCTNCGAENSNKSKTCSFCGEKMANTKKKRNQIICSGCEQPVAIKYQYCPYCGTENEKDLKVIHPTAKPKRPLGSRIVIGLGIALLVVLLITAASLFKYTWQNIQLKESVNETETVQQMAEEASDEASDEETSAGADEDEEGWADIEYDAGDYTVGQDIPAGMYVLFYDTESAFGNCGFYNVPEPDMLGERRYRSDFEYFDVVYLKAGDYIRAIRCTLQPIEKIDWIADDYFTYSDGTYYSGGYVVGETLPAGTYVVSSIYESDSDYEASLKVWDSVQQRRLEMRKEASSSEMQYDVTQKDETVTLTEGQYILGEGIYLIPEVLAEDLIVS